jgi:DNA-binding LacI/PurR family transcriptional regulator
VVTIADVAGHAGVGAGTVSRVLNNSSKVSDATRERVLASIAELEYHPSPLARGLSRGRCQTVGVVVPFFTQPSAIERLRGVVAALDGSRHDLVLFNVESPTHLEEHFLSLARRDRADGLLIMSVPPPFDHLARLTAAGVPVVLVDAAGGHVSGESGRAGIPSVPSVGIDDVEGGRIATRHLVDLGHVRIAFIGDDPANPFGFTSSTRREHGYHQVLAEAGLADDPDHDHDYVCYGAHDRLVGEGLAANLLALRPRPTAIFAASDMQALGVLEAARRLGLSVPGDLSVVGFDDVEISAYAGLTTVRQPLFDSGHHGARLLLDALQGEGLPSPGVHELDIHLVERSTTAEWAHG